VRSLHDATERHLDAAIGTAEQLDEIY
jgi:hypothetical protein